MSGMMGARTHVPAEAASPSRSAPQPALLARAGSARPRGAMPAAHVIQNAVADSPRPMEAEARALLEHRFGRPLGDVRIHTGPSAAEAARQAGAEAFTVGNDVMFGSGRYDPGSPDGLELLAHEVAHTVQQRGAVQPGTPVTQFAGVSERSSALEREADAAARHVVAGPSVAGGAGALLASRATGPVLSRRAIEWVKIPSGTTTLDGGMNIDEYEKESDRIVRFRVPKLFLPREKGRVIEAYRAAVKGGGEGASGLETTIELEGSKARAGLWESRAPTPDLNRRWLGKVGWTPAEANARWYAAGGKKGTGFPTGNPGVVCSTCDIDHIVELQLGGSNSPSNLTPLNSAENQKSGREIWQTISGMARDLRPLVPAQTGKVNVILSFQDVDQIGGPVPRPSGVPTPGCATCSCSDVDAYAVDQAKSATAAAAGRENYPVVAGGQQATFQVPPGEADVELLGDQVNLANAEVIPGMILETLERPKTGHVVRAFIESKPHFKRAKATRLPLAIQGPQEEVVLDALPIEGGRRLKIKGNEHPKVNFTYPYLSTGWLNLDLGADGLTGDGQLTPSVPLLRTSPIDVHFGRGAFTGVLNADPKRLALPIPGFTVTAASLKVDLAPDLAVTGSADFGIGRLITGHVEAQPSLSGIWLKGDLLAHIPRIDAAKGEVEYREGALRGSLLLTAEQFGNLPGNPKGELRLGVDSKGLTAEGKLSVSLPGGKPLDLEARRTHSTGIYLSGRTSFEIPGLHPLDITVGYDGEHFSGQASTGVTYKGLTGNVKVKYWDGQFSGETDASFEKGRLAGKVHLVIESNGDLSGEGEATVRITKDLTGKIGVTKPKGGEIGVKGELILPDPITLFPEKSVKDTLFSKAFSFNVFGPVILQIRPSIGYAAGVGPGTINKTKVGAGFKPFAPEADFELWASATLNVPAYAEITAAIGLGVGLGLGAAASVAGGIEIAGTLRFGTEFSAAFDIHYKDGVFTAKALIEVGSGLKILVDINGYVHAEGLGISVYDQKWNLKHFEWDTGLSFLLSLPLEYASNKPFALPDRDRMTLKGPDFSIDQMAAGLRRTLGV